MLDVLEIVLPQSTIRVPVLKQDVGPVGRVHILEEQEGLGNCQQRGISGGGYALATARGSPSSRQIDSQTRMDYQAR